ncbi:transposase [Arthrobacter phage Rings]|uniref:Transposase n=1 Tax=Arthrobacter phage Rings TaxID=1772313 RepID=A0A0U4JDP2_9CAUD|nr:transposase [Arthrobacter phage Rings]
MSVTEKLQRAADIWADASGHAPSSIELIEELQEMGIFSNRQIAKIVRVSSSFVQGVGPSSSGGGKFNPATLTALVTLSKLHDRNVKLPNNLLKAVVDDGTSLNYVARVLGMSHGLLYYQFNKQQEV